MTQFSCDVWYLPYYLSNVRLMLVLLQNGKLVGSGLGYFEESVTSHLHYTWIIFLHEFKEFADDCS